MHANIQKDGTYSVVPRMWGGLTNPRELRAIADAAEKYGVPTVKVTGGQRIDLLGVKKEQLPAIWADLNDAGLVSGHAYGKALRTVKTCVGSEWCRFGTQDSTGLGVKLEKMCWGSWTPHKVKLAVSGCPRNCAEATIKDVGVVCVDAGYDIVVGGNGGIEVRVTDPLARVATEAEVLEHVGAFLQLYREEARYLERTAPWVARVGIEYVRRRIVEDADGRRALHRRFLFSQSFVQKDPWAERAAGAAAHEYRALAEVERSERDAGGQAGSRSAASTTSRCAARGVSCRPDGAPPVAVFRTGDDEIFALIDRCPHRGGPLSRGHRAGERGRLPAARLGHRAGQRPGRGARRGLHPHGGGAARRRPHPAALPSCDDGRRAALGRRHERRGATSARPAPIAASAAG